jgi:phosphoglycolate phosphatase
VVKVGNSECEFLKLTPLSRISAIVGAVCGVTIRPRNPSGTNRIRLWGGLFCADAVPANINVRAADNNITERRIKISPCEANYGLRRRPCLVLLYDGIVTAAPAGPVVIPEVLRDVKPAPCERPHAFRRGQLPLCIDIHLLYGWDDLTDVAGMNAIYFDLDGTLTDPKPGITRSIQYALAKLGRDVPTEDELTWCIGPPLHASLKKLLGTDDLADKALLLYRERFVEIGLFENVVYPGVEETLSAVASSGRRLFVATSKPGIYAERIIDHFKLTAYFERVFGSELDGTRSDKTDLLGYALRTTGVDPSQAVMIGDRSHE